MDLIHGPAITAGFALLSRRLARDLPLNIDDGLVDAVGHAAVEVGGVVLAGLGLARRDLEAELGGCLGFGYLGRIGAGDPDKDGHEDECSVDGGADHLSVPFQVD